MQGQGVVAAFCILLSLALLPAGASSADSVVPEGTAQVMTNQLGAFTRTRPRGAMDKATVFFRGDAVRIQFQDDAGKAYALVLPAGSGSGWVEDAHGGMLPLPPGRWPLHANPDQPCAGQGLFADCQRMGAGVYAGRNARQWRYRLANPTGPGMTRQGVMWLDEDTGFVLGYDGDARAGTGKHWQVRTVQYGPLPDALFEKPQSTDHPR